MHVDINVFGIELQFRAFAKVVHAIFIGFYCDESVDKVYVMLK